MEGIRISGGTVVSPRHYLADADFLVGLEGPLPLLRHIEHGLQDPVWPLSLGRKSYVPTLPVTLPPNSPSVPQFARSVSKKHSNPSSIHLTAAGSGLWIRSGNALSLKRHSNRRLRHGRMSLSHSSSAPSVSGGWIPTGWSCPMSNQIYLSRLVPNLRSREARRDLADCMAMHRTLMSAFPDHLSSNGTARAEAGLLYRLETTVAGNIGLLVQSALPPEWVQLPPSWLHPDAEPQVKDITEALARIDSGSLLRFKLVANPTRKIDTKSGADGRKNNGKRVELSGEQEWLAWLERKAGQSGFRLKAVRAASHVPDVRSSRDLRTTGRKGRQMVPRPG